ncbi:Peptidyl-prolyl cis-trans isomerase FKBP16-3, chloroplastic [Sesamum angolense]|uniref:Peptidyl-prolyl cis-trans isomerase FKBP16-3, chloroplastic n=1 Tax=Sesamum angolense TaxID=2727404 RepID=A0AAE1T6X5_9LAMI|nr:Peptidyl-prolyl cis-trans isomerase FKBP16-3, chloroplastic [Sesamum angolense]
MCSLCARATVECAEDGRVKEANVMLPLCKASSGGGWVQHRKIPERKKPLVPMVTSKFGLQYKDIKVGGRRSPPVGFQVAANYIAVVPSGQIFDRTSYSTTSSKSPIACASAFETLEGSDDEDNVTDVDKLDTTYLLTNGNVNECHLCRSERLRTKVKNPKKEGQVEERHPEDLDDEDNVAKLDTTYLLTNGNVNSHSAAKILRFANYGCCILLCCINDFVSEFKNENANARNTCPIRECLI